MFALSLIFLALGNYFEIDFNKGYINKNLIFYSQNFFPNSSLLQYRKYSIFILIIQNYFLVLTSLMIILGKKLSLFFLIIFFIIDAILIHNPFISDDTDNLITILQFLALIGGLLNI
jgi:hypothetical protein